MKAIIRNKTPQFREKGRGILNIFGNLSFFPCVCNRTWQLYQQENAPLALNLCTNLRCASKMPYNSRIDKYVKLRLANKRRNPQENASEHTCTKIQGSCIHPCSWHGVCLEANPSGLWSESSGRLLKRITKGNQYKPDPAVLAPVKLMESWLCWNQSREVLLGTKI